MNGDVYTLTFGFLLEAADPSHESLAVPELLNAHLVLIKHLYTFHCGIAIPQLLNAHLVLTFVYISFWDFYFISFYF